MSFRRALALPIVALALLALPERPSLAQPLPAPEVAAPALLDPPDGTRLGDLSTMLRWENPPRTTQYHLQVIPWNNDGPGIDLIIGDASQVSAASYSVKAPQFGVGNYVILPGATYTWRVRVSDATNSLSASASEWSLWSATRSFSTPKPSALTIQLVSPVAGRTIQTDVPTLLWEDSNGQMFYYEIQLSSDANFGAGEDGPIASVYWNLVHGGNAAPPNSWTVPSSSPLQRGVTYYWRVRQRVQATPNGSLEPGVTWGFIESFTVQ